MKWPIERVERVCRFLPPNARRIDFILAAGKGVLIHVAKAIVAWSDNQEGAG